MCDERFAGLRITSRKIEMAREALLIELSRLRFEFDEIFKMNLRRSCSLRLLLGGRRRASSLNIPVGEGDLVRVLPDTWL